MTEPRRYACFNSRSRKPSYLAQDGWIVVAATDSQVTRLPRMVEVPDVMSTDCDYSRRTPDPRCPGCCHYQGPA